MCNKHYRNKNYLKCHSPAVAVDTFPAADSGTGHQGAGLGLGTDYHRNHACGKKDSRVKTRKVPDQRRTFKGERERPHRKD